jgi:hypothetical protein
MRIAVLSALLGALLAGCIANPVTSLEVSWVAPQVPPFKKLLIITVASDEFVQIAFQDQMAAPPTATSPATPRPSGRASSRASTNRTPISCCLRE